MGLLKSMELMSVEKGFSRDVSLWECCVCVTVL